MNHTSFDNMIACGVAGAPGTEVVLSHVVLPANVSLPRHWHPGEEFAYVVEGEVTLKVEGEADATFGAGDAAQVPHRRVHTITTGARGVRLVVFRVHEAGQPERTLVEEEAQA